MNKLDELITSVDTSTLKPKTDLAGFRNKADNLDVYKLNTSLADWTQLSNVVDNDGIKKTF